MFWEFWLNICSEEGRSEKNVDFKEIASMMKMLMKVKKQNLGWTFYLWDSDCWDFVNHTDD